MVIDLNTEECKEIAIVMTEAIHTLDVTLARTRRDTEPGIYGQLAAGRARLIALRNKFVPGIKATLD